MSSTVYPVASSSAGGVTVTVSQPVYQPAYPPQPPPAYPVVNQPQHNVVMMQQQPTVLNVTMPQFRQSPVWMICPNCNKNIQTNVYYKISGYTWLIAALVCFFAPLGCCLVPFCLNSCKDAEHICPSCNRMVGRFHRL